MELTLQVKPKETKVARIPTEGKWFKVNPLAIDQNLFKEERENSMQETTRQYILEAFEEMKMNSKYAKPFKTMIPKKTWETKSVEELKKLAQRLGNHNADWVEQALEWAQRISNGESWDEICNKQDTANWYRLVVWKCGYARLVGGSRNGIGSNPLSGDCCAPHGLNSNPTSAVGHYQYYIYDNMSEVVPLVVKYK